MRVVNLSVGDSRRRRVSLGRRGENEAARIVFDVSALAERHGAGTCVLLVKRPGEAAAYPAAVEQSGSTVSWTVSETDTSYVGQGECELFWYVGGALAKSVVYKTNVEKDIGAASETPPDPYETWLDTLTEAAAEVTEAIGTFTGLSVSAETLPAGSGAAASYEDGVLSLGIPQGAKGDKGDSGPAGAVGADGNAIWRTRALPSFDADDDAGWMFSDLTGRSGRPIVGDLIVYSATMLYAITAVSGSFAKVALIGSIKGAAGAAGPAGPGVPAGGAAGQFLVKSGATDYAAEWVTIPSASGVSF